MPEQHYEPEPALAGAAAGGAVDLDVVEARTPERRPQGPDGSGPRGKPRSLWSDAWRDLRRNPVFLVSALVILFLVLISLWPSAITSGSPLTCDLSKAQEGSRAGHPFGFDGQGCDVYTRTVYGARTSVAVGVLATLGVAVLGSVLGRPGGLSSGAPGTPSSPASPTSSSPSRSSSADWCCSPSSPATPSGPSSASSCCSAGRRSPASPAAPSSPPGRTTTSRPRGALGASRSRLVLRHIAPNAVAPVIVVATIALGTYIALEATLSYLGVGLKPPSVSWGIDISAASPYIRNAPHALLWPSGPSRSPSWRSSCSATRCATPSTRN
ncbi:hypothetical protein GCM10023238_37880 [Streptomyces heliomycini]